MNKYDQIRARYRQSWRTRDDWNRMTGAMTLAISSAEKLSGKASELRESGRLSPKGLTDEIRTFAGKEIVPALRRAAFIVDKEQTVAARRRRHLAVPAPDKSDVAAAILRMDLRNWLRGLKPGEIAGVVLADDVEPVLLQAVFEVPPAALNMPEQFRADIEKRLIEKIYTGELSAIEEHVEAIGVVNAALRMAVNDLRSAVEFKHEREFELFLKENSRGVESELAHEASKDAIAMPEKPLTVRPIGEVLDEEFARIDAKYGVPATNAA